MVKVWDGVCHVTWAGGWLGGWVVPWSAHAFAHRLAASPTPASINAKHSMLSSPQCEYLGAPERSITLNFSKSATNSERSSGGIWHAHVLVWEPVCLPDSAAQQDASGGSHAVDAQGAYCAFHWPTCVCIPAAARHPLARSCGSVLPVPAPGLQRVRPALCSRVCPALVGAAVPAARHMQRCQHTAPECMLWRPASPAMPAWTSC